MSGSIVRVWGVSSRDNDRELLLKHRQGLRYHPDTGVEMGVWIPLERQYRYNDDEMAVVQRYIDETPDADTELVVRDTREAGRAALAATAPQSATNTGSTGGEAQALTGQFIRPPFYNRLLRYLLGDGKGGKIRPNVMLSGPAGNGKTLTAHQVLREIGQEYIEYDCTIFTSERHLIGQDVLEAEHGVPVTRWEDGIFPEAFKLGKSIVLNEVDALTGEAMMLLQSVLQTDMRGVNTPYGKIEPNGPCYVVMTANTTGNGASREYSGRSVLDAASLDRIEIISTGYYSTEEILLSHGVSKSIARNVASWAEAVRVELDRAGVRAPLSNRRIITIAESMELGVDFNTAASEAYLERLDEAQRAVLAQYFHHDYVVKVLKQHADKERERRELASRGA